MEGWTLIYTSNKLYQIEIVKAILADHGIESQEMNKKDSAYLVGDIELYVPTERAFEANQVLKENFSE